MAVASTDTTAPPGPGEHRIGRLGHPDPSRSLDHHVPHGSPFGPASGAPYSRTPACPSDPVRRTAVAHAGPGPAKCPDMRNPHAGEPFDTPDSEIAAALDDVSIPTLLLSLVHMSGDPEIIRGRLRPAGLFLNEVQGYMTEEDKAEARALALEVIRDYRDRGCPEPEPLPAELLHEMMSWLVCEEVPEEYVPLLMEEMELDGRDARRVEPAGHADDREAFPVVVIGCGQSGLLAGIRLQGGRHPVHDRREERRRRRHLVGELLPRRPGRRRQPLLLLLLRAERPLDRVLRPPARAPALLRVGDGQARHRAPRPVGDRGARRHLGRGDGHLVGARADGRRHRGAC